jgi:DNA-binding transcriptional MocR family regulator
MITNWSPRIQEGASPLYLAIADALERDVESGMIREGQRLPTHRELAASLGLTPLTITRAYKEAARRGLIQSTVGRGTFVRAAAENPRPESGLVDLSHNVVDGGDALPLEARAVGALRSILRDVEYQPAEGTLRHRTAAAAWMRRARLETSPDHVVITPGAHQAIVALLAAACRPGDTILTEELTYPRVSTIAALLHLNVETVELDDHGAVPESIEKACKKSGAQALYLIPNFQNPTGSVMPERRRHEIAAIAKRNDLLLIEDDVYGFLLESPPHPIAIYAPESTAFVTSASKSLTPSLRIGFASVPQRWIERVTAACAALTAFTSTVDGELFTQLVDTGAADRSIAAKRSVIATNRRAAARALGSLEPRAHAMSPHLWIALPDGVEAHELAERARLRGIGIAAGPSFSPHRKPPVEAVRISIGAVANAGQVESAMRTLASLMRDPRLGSSVVV